MVEFSITPIGKGESLSTYVARVIAKISKSGVSYKLTPMGTIIETKTVKKAFSVIEKGINTIVRDSRVNRASVLIKIDWRKSSMGRIGSKVNSVHKKLNN
ncbi:MTH1187 family thiamine-binding protein [Elusimicrobiota bacterium]